MNKPDPTANTREIPHFLASARHVRAHDCLDFVTLYFGGPVAKLYMAREEDIWDFVVDKVGAYLVYEHDYSYYAYDEANAIDKVCERPLNNLLRAITGAKLYKGEEAQEIVDSFRRKYGSAKGDWCRYFDMILEESGLSGKFKWEVYPEGLPDLASLMEGKLVIDGRLIAEVG